MKVFLSWSGETSHNVAKLLRDWLPNVIQSLRVYVSSEDLDKGARWLQDISGELADTNYGILCVTKRNLTAPWLNFEAGALSKTLDKSKVAPFLFDLSRSDVSGPILQFQSTVFDREDVLKLMHSLNGADPDGAIDRSRLDRIFERWWPDLEFELSKLLNTTQTEVTLGTTTPPHDKVVSMVEEVLELTRQHSKLLNAQERLASWLRGNPAINLSTIAVLDLMNAWTDLVNEVAKIEMSPEDFSSVDKKVRAGREVVNLLRRSPETSKHLISHNYPDS
jgi:hypothetical protein